MFLHQIEATRFRKTVAHRSRAVFAGSIAQVIRHARDSLHSSHRSQGARVLGEEDVPVKKDVTLVR